MKKNNCTHPKSKVATWFDNKTNTYHEHCCRCGTKVYTKKFVGAKNGN